METQTVCAVVVHNIAQARAVFAAAQEAGCSVVLLSPAGMAAYAGVTYFQHMVDQAAAGFSSVQYETILDCADFSGLALAALRHGIKKLQFEGDCDRLGSMGAEIYPPFRSVLDLKDKKDVYSATLEWFGCCKS